MWRLENLRIKLKLNKMVKNNHFEILEWTKGEKIEKHWLMKNCQNSGTKVGTAGFLAGVVCIPHSQGGWVAVSPGGGWPSKPAALLPAKTDLIGGRGQEPATGNDARKMSKLARKQMRSRGSWAGTATVARVSDDQWARRNIQPGDRETREPQLTESREGLSAPRVSA